MKKILIADDHYEIRELLKDTLSDNNYEIHVAEMGKVPLKLRKNISRTLL